MRLTRLSPNIYEYNFGGSVNLLRIIEWSNIKYEDKITKIIYGIGSAADGNRITQADVEVYGRNLYE